MADNTGEKTIPYGNGDDFAVLRCTLGASKKISTAFGGFIEAFRRISLYDQDAFITVIAAGLGKEKKDVEEPVFQAGMQRLQEPVAEYLTLLSNGGRPREIETEQKAAPKGEA